MIISLLILMMYGYQQTLPSALTRVAAPLRFCGYHLQVMNAPPISSNLRINPNRLSHRDYCLCVSMFVRTFACVYAGLGVDPRAYLLAIYG